LRASRRRSKSTEHLDLGLTSCEGRINQNCTTTFSPMGFRWYWTCPVFRSVSFSHQRLLCVIAAQGNITNGRREGFTQHRTRLVQRRNCASEVASGRPSTLALTTKVDRKREGEKGRQVQSQRPAGGCFQKEKRTPPPLIQTFI